MVEPEPMDVFSNVYSSPNSMLDRQRDQYASYLASFEAAEEVAK
jgi:pyruvate dehydrogenase E1 component alpha subunit